MARLRKGRAIGGVRAGVGLFVHWGLYAIPAGHWQGRFVPGLGEWIMHDGKIPVGEYAGLAGQFNPVKFDAGQWVQLARDAGMRYIVVTAKHHDGFAMYHSRVSAFNVFDATPFHRDPLQELKAACGKQDMRLGFFYSQAQDWHHPGGAMYGPPWDQAQTGVFSDYLKKVAVPQVDELLSGYDPAVIWWDTPKSMTPEGAALFTALLKQHPKVLSNDRLGGGVPGDFATSERTLPAAGAMVRDWEACMTMNRTWGYKSTDQNWKPARLLLLELIDAASKGGNYLLNVGPTAEGEIPKPSIERLKAIGGERGQWGGKGVRARSLTGAFEFRRRLGWHAVFGFNFREQEMGSGEWRLIKALPGQMDPISTRPRAARRRDACKFEGSRGAGGAAPAGNRAKWPAKVRKRP